MAWATMWVCIDSRGWWVCDDGGGCGEGLEEWVCQREEGWHGTGV